MNARSQVFELALEWRQVEEAVLSIFHTVIFHRSYGKFTYQSDSSYFVGTLGFEDVDCDFIDATYVRASSSELDAALRSALANFAEDLRKLGEGKHPSTTGSGSLSSTGGGSAPAHLGAGGLGSGQVSLEFFQKRRRWPFAPDYIPWEVWTVKTELVSLTNEHDRQRWQEKVGEMLSDKIMYVAEVMNRHDYVPKMPSQAELELVFDTSFPDVQPYLFKISHATASSPSVGTTVRKLLRDTLAI